MKQLVKLNRRPSSDGRSYVYVLRYVDLDGKRKWQSLGHSDRRKAEKERARLEKELLMGFQAPGDLRLSQFMAEGIKRTGDQIRTSTRVEYCYAMKDFIGTIGDISFRSVTLSHGERYRQVCLDRKESPANVAKKLRHLKRAFELAVKRGQLDDNPLRHIDMPKVPKKKVRVYTPDECNRMIKSAREFTERLDPARNLRWDAFIILALSTGMRRGELLNLVWADISFDTQVIDIAEKQDTPSTWQWLIKDHDQRSLPLTDEVTKLLIGIQGRQPEGYPYVFVPTARYDHIQRVLRPAGQWDLIAVRNKIVNNFSRQFGQILGRAGIKKKGTFHDIRRTALSNWFAHGMTETDVMNLAGHSDFSTTHEFYLAVAPDLISRARQAASQATRDSVAIVGALPDPTT